MEDNIKVDLKESANYLTHSIIIAIESMKMKWTGNDARQTKIRNTQKILGRKPHG
jgi:hypothetical protein